MVTYKCALLISITEDAYRRHFLRYFPDTARKIIQQRVDEEKFRSVGYLNWTNKYLTSQCDGTRVKLVTTSLGLDCKRVSKIMLVQSSIALKNIKHYKKKECKYISPKTKHSLIRKLLYYAKLRYQTYKGNFVYNKMNHKF